MSKQPWEDQFNEIDAKESLFQKKWFLTTVSVVAGLLGITILYFLYYPSNSDFNRNYVVAAKQSSFKYKPKDPGGMRIDHQDKEVYNQTANSDAEPPVVLISNSKETPVTLIEQAPPLESYEAEKRLPAPPLVREVIMEPLEDELTSNAASVEQKEILYRPKTGFALKTEKPATEHNDFYTVQLASHQHLGRAERDMRSLNERYKTLLSTVGLRITSSKLAQNSVYRVHTGRISGSARAHSLCQKLKKTGANCFVKKSV